MKEHRQQQIRNRRELRVQQLKTREINPPRSSTDRAFRLMERWGSGLPEKSLEDVAREATLSR